MLEVGSEVKQAARKAQTDVKSTARQARKISGVEQAEGQVKCAVASEENLAIARYDSLRASRRPNVGGRSAAPPERVRAAATDRPSRCA